MMHASGAGTKPSSMHAAEPAVSIHNKISRTNPNPLFALKPMLVTVCQGVRKHRGQHDYEQQLFRQPFWLQIACKRDQ